MGLNIKPFFQQVHLFVGDGVDQRQVGDLHIDFGGFFSGLNETEGLVQILARAVNAVLAPDHQAGGEHLFSRGLANLVGATEHPGQHVHAFREDHDALGAHLPESAGELPLVQGVHIGHGQQVGGVAMHHHAVFRVHFQAGHMAHHVGGEFAGEAAAVLKAPDQFGQLAVGGDAHDAQVDFGSVLPVQARELFYQRPCPLLDYRRDS